MAKNEKITNAQELDIFMEKRKTDLARIMQKKEKILSEMQELKALCLNDEDYITQSEPLIKKFAEVTAEICAFWEFPRGGDF